MGRAYSWSVPPAEGVWGSLLRRQPARLPLLGDPPPARLPVVAAPLEAVLRRLLLPPRDKGVGPLGRDTLADEAVARSGSTSLVEALRGRPAAPGVLIAACRRRSALRGARACWPIRARPRGCDGLGP